MADQFLLVCLILADALVVQAMANEKLWTRVDYPHVVVPISFSIPPILMSSSSNSGKLDTDKEVAFRRLRKHQHKDVMESYVHAPTVSPSFSREEMEIVEAPIINGPAKEITSLDRPLLSTEPETNQETETEKAAAAAPPPLRQPRKLHSTHDKSIAGGGVILVGLATTFLVSVFCYIRATKRNAV